MRHADYTNTGFDRGHLCPSDDRDSTADENRTTFLLSNIVPQAPLFNRQSWRLLEEYTRSLLAAGNECYIIVGATGQGGTGDTGNASTLASGKLTVPAILWKVIVVLPVGSNDVQRVNAQTRVIAVWTSGRLAAAMPNINTVGENKWSGYRVSIDQIEQRTSYDLLSPMPQCSRYWKQGRNKRLFRPLCPCRASCNAVVFSQCPTLNPYVQASPAQLVAGRILMHISAAGPNRRTSVADDGRRVMHGADSRLFNYVLMRLKAGPMHPLLTHEPVALFNVFSEDTKLQNGYFKLLETEDNLSSDQLQALILVWKTDQ